MKDKNDWAMSLSCSFPSCPHPTFNPFLRSPSAKRGEGERERWSKKDVNFHSPYSRNVPSAFPREFVDTQW